MNHPDESHMRAKIAIKKISDIDDYDHIRGGIESLLNYLKDDFQPFNGGTVLIKVNLCLLLGPETGATVDPRVARAIIEWLKANSPVRKIIIAEADATHLSADMAFKALGWRKYFKEFDSDVEFCNLSQDKRVEAKTCCGRNIEMSARYMEADTLISLAKLKTHSLQKITCTMKNLFGALPEKYKIKYHPNLTDSICEFASVRPPDLSIIDGLIGMDGKGPVNGFPKICQLLIAGTDMVATDYFCAKVMGFRPKSVPHIYRAIEFKLGKSLYDVIGDLLNGENLKFKLMPTWEEYVRKSIKRVRDRKNKGSMGDAGNEIWEV